MTKKYKHLPTGKVYHQFKEGGNLYCGETALPHFLLDGKDWEEVKYKPSSYHIITYAANEIFSVRRERDGEEFRVGNIVITNKLGAALPISKIYLNKTIDTIEVECGDCTYNLDDLIKVKEKSKEWEITAYKSAIINGRLYSIPIGGIGKLVKENPDDSIFAVKRLSDGVEFKIGDSYRSKYNPKGRKIELIMVVNGFLFLHDSKAAWSGEELDCRIDQAIKIEKLFTTEDGVDIYEEDYIYRLVNAEGIVDTRIKAHKIHVNWGEKWFSTKQAAEEYILMNKPCLSINDLLHNLNWSMNSFVINKLKELAKSKMGKKQFSK